MIDLDKYTTVEIELIKILNSVRDEWYIYKTLKGDKNWTIRIKHLFANYGSLLGYEVCGSGLCDHHGEWLYDLVWYKNTNEGLLESVPLVVESEWKRNLKDIQYDFEKLLLSNSSLRLMICQTNTNNIYELKQYFSKAVESYKLLKKGDRFLIAILDDLITAEFHFELIIKE